MTSRPSTLPTKRKKSREERNFALIGNIGRLDHYVLKFSDPGAPKSSRNPNHECSDHQSAEVINFPYH